MDNLDATFGTSRCNFCLQTESKLIFKAAAFFYNAFTFHVKLKSENIIYTFITDADDYLNHLYAILFTMGF